VDLHDNNFILYTITIVILVTSSSLRELEWECIGQIRGGSGWLRESRGEGWLGGWSFE
jgi:hypothetical protein